MEKRKLEVLAPAGSFESLKAAVSAGADAVYMGGSKFGARAYAQNPEGKILLDAIDYAHLYGVKLYLTVNTLLKDQELEQELYEYLKPCYEHGLDAVLVQDLGVLCAIRKWFPVSSGTCQHPDDDLRTGFRGASEGNGRRACCPFQRTEPEGDCRHLSEDGNGAGDLCPWSPLLLLFRAVPVQ